MKDRTAARTIHPGEDESHLPGLVQSLIEAESIAALSGAGISTESGIPDFRSPGGLWTVFPPEEYATIEVFRRDPARAWKLYRAIGDTVTGPLPNDGHRALARLEGAGRLDVTVTQNVDGLHQAAGSRAVIEIHGDHQHLQCIACGWIGPFPGAVLDDEDVPLCPECSRPVKPNVVLFGEDVRHMDAIGAALERCDVLLVVGTSAQVYPAAGLPDLVQSRGGLIVEFNREETGLTRGGTAGGWGGLFGRAARSDYRFSGPASRSLTLLADALLT